MRHPRRTRHQDSRFNRHMRRTALVLYNPAPRDGVCHVLSVGCDKQRCNESTYRLQKCHDAKSVIVRVDEPAANERCRPEAAWPLCWRI